MRTDRMSAPRNLFQGLRIGKRHPPHAEEGGPGAVCGQSVQYQLRVAAKRPVIKGQDDLAVLQEVVILVLQATEAWSCGGIDLYGPRDANGVLRRALRRCRPGRQPWRRANQQSAHQYGQGAHSEGATPTFPS